MKKEIFEQLSAKEQSVLNQTDLLKKEATKIVYDLLKLILEKHPNINFIKFKTSWSGSTIKIETTNQTFDEILEKYEKGTYNNSYYKASPLKIKVVDPRVSKNHIFERWPHEINKTSKDQPSLAIGDKCYLPLYLLESKITAPASRNSKLKSDGLDLLCHAYSDLFLLLQFSGLDNMIFDRYANITDARILCEVIP
jgi:hypothetical protein